MTEMCSHFGNKMANLARFAAQEQVFILTHPNEDFGVKLTHSEKCKMNGILLSATWLYKKIFQTNCGGDKITAFLHEDRWQSKQISLKCIPGLVNNMVALVIYAITGLGNDQSPFHCQSFSESMLNHWVMCRLNPTKKKFSEFRIKKNFINISWLILSPDKRPTFCRGLGVLYKHQCQESFLIH